MFALIEAAGWPIWPLLLASIIALAIIGERAWSLRRSIVAPKALLGQVIQEYRQNGANPVAYPAERFAKLQFAAYPDLTTVTVERSSEEVFDLVMSAMGDQHLKMNIVRQEPPTSKPVKAGYIEAEDRTLIIGFYDDIVVRVEGDEKRARLDVRSASRYGRHDFGRNADRVRSILREFVAALERNVPTAAGERYRRPVPKRPKERTAKSGDPRSAKGGAPTGAPHARGQKVSPRSKDEHRGPSKRSGQPNE